MSAGSFGSVVNHYHCELVLRASPNISVVTASVLPHVSLFKEGNDV